MQLQFDIIDRASNFVCPLLKVMSFKLHTLYISTLAGIQMGIFIYLIFVAILSSGCDKTNNGLSDETTTTDKL